MDQFTEIAISVTAGFLATFFGVSLAFLLDRYRESEAEKTEATRILRLTRREVIANREILSGTMKEPVDLASPGVPHIRTIRNTWEGIASKLDVVKNDELLEELTLLYFLLAALDRMLELYEEFAIEYIYRDPAAREHLKSRLVDQHDHYASYITGQILPQIEKVLRLLNAELPHEIHTP